MKYIQLMVCCLALITVISGTASAQTITLVHNNRTSFPFIIINESGQTDAKKPGAVVDFLLMVGEIVGVEIEFRAVPWANGLDAVKRGTVDGIFQASYTPDRTKIGVFPMKNGKLDRTRRIQSMGYHFYVPKGSTLRWDGKKLYNLDGRKVSTIEGYSIINDLQKKGIPYEENTSVEADLRKTLMRPNHIAATVNIESIIDHLIKSHPAEFGEFIKLEPALKEKEYYLLLSFPFARNNPQLAKSIWDTIRDLRDKGEFVKCIERYTNQ